MIKKKLAKITALLIAATMGTAMFAGCGKSGGSSDTLNILVWSEYIPDSVLSQFEKDHNCKINVTTHDSNENCLAKLKSEKEGTYDVVMCGDYMIEQMAKGGLIQELDHSKLPNMSNMDDAYMSPSYDPGNKYSMPYQGGIMAIGINTDLITDDITSYEDLYDSKYEGKLVVADDMRIMLGLAAKTLGYGLNETDSDILSKVEEKMLTLKPNISVYDSDSPKSELISGDCAIGVTWNAEIALAMAEVPSIKIVYPSEGSCLFFDNWAIPTGSTKTDLAYEFINYMMDAETAKTVSEEFPYLCPNKAAIELLGSEYTDNPAKNVPTEEIAKGEYVQNIDNDSLAIYNDIWTNLKK